MYSITSTVIIAAFGALQCLQPNGCSWTGPPQNETCWLLVGVVLVGNGCPKIFAFHSNRRFRDACWRHVSFLRLETGLWALPHNVPRASLVNRDPHRNNLISCFHFGPWCSQSPLFSDPLLSDKKTQTRWLFFWEISLATGIGMIRYDYIDD